ncbi:aldehyde ferredoxin oxidoreductase family protein [Actinoallomurus liliacearum]|uniref:Aldehyde ferredoxin oxidoreductase family protein n=1 Tax=Actinoallomurus liliacearum TaxID=1080073 RepID=A0ABP8TP36_9ACTN
MAVAHVDLSARTAWTATSDPAAAAYVRGGPLEALEGLLAALSDGGEDIDPVDAPVALVAGPVAGVAGPGLARITAIGLSPLSGGIADTRAEGPFAAGLRRAGLTGIVLHGRAPEPVTALVQDGTVTLVPAGDLWGMETGAATDALTRRHGADAAVAVIGPAGEHGVRYATVVTCRDHPLPRHGFGALLGGKRVKAVVCVGRSEPYVADPDALTRITAAYADAVPKNTLAAWQRGTPGFAVWRGEPGYANVANFTGTRTPGGVDPTAAPALERVAACPGCPTDCVKVYAGAAVHQESLAALGPGAGGPDPWALNARCLQLGLDPVSLAGTLAAAGIPSDAIPDTVERLAYRRDDTGLGDGAARLRATADAPMVGKGVELPPFDPRVQPNLGLGFAVAPVGPRYDIVEHDLDFDAERGMPACFPEARRVGVEVPRPLGRLDPAGTAVLMRLWSGLDALGVCLFAATPTRPLTLGDVEDLVEAVTGERPDVLGLGARRLSLQRRVNHLRGLGPEHDTLPERFFTEPVQSGPYAGAVLDRASFDRAVDVLREQLGFPS